MTAPQHAASPPTGTSTGRWYLWVAGLSCGVFACIPFWHAAQQLQRPDVRKWALVFTGVTVYLVVLAMLTPESNPDGTGGNSVLGSLGGFSALAAMVVALIRLNGLRHEVYGGVTPAVRPLHADPAIAAVLAARNRRTEARELLGRDRAMARELGVGRPDLSRGYDDGGLVDLSSAPAAVIATVCDITPAQAESITQVRAAGGGGVYFTIDELLMDVRLPLDAEEKVRDRAFL